MEKQIEIASKLYRCRKASKILMGEFYPEKIKSYQAVIEAKMKESDIDVLPALLQLATELKEEAFVTIHLCSAAVELIESAPKAEKAATGN